MQAKIHSFFYSVIALKYLSSFDFYQFSIGDVVLFFAFFPDLFVEVVLLS